jgi:hypothetical protein
MFDNGKNTMQKIQTLVPALSLVTKGTITIGTDTKGTDTIGANTKGANIIGINSIGNNDAMTLGSTFQKAAKIRN